MLDRNHALSGALAGYAITALVHTPTITSVLIVVTAAGATCLPDLDEPGSAVADTFGGLSQTIADLIKRLAHGHRRGTHTILAAAGTTVVATMFVVLAPISGAIIVGVLTSIAFRCAAPRQWRKSIYGLVLGTGAAVLAVRYPPGSLVAWAIGVGYLLHLVGDVVTASGAPVLLPFAEHKVSVPLLGVVGSLRERITGAVMLVMLFVATWAMFHGLLPR